MHADQDDDAHDSWVELRKELDPSSGPLTKRLRAAYSQQPWFHKESEEYAEL